MRGVHEETGADSIFSGGSWDDVKVLAGRWDGGGKELAISIFTDFSYGSAYSAVGNLTIGNEDGKIYLFGTEGSDVYVWCYMDDGEEMILRHKGNGSMEVWFASDGIGIEEGTQFECVERFRS